MDNVTGLAEALGFVANERTALHQRQRIDIDGRTYYFGPDHKLHRIEEPTPPRLDLDTLTGFVDYIKANPDGIKEDLFAVVESYKSVILCGPTFGPFKQRVEYVSALCGLENSRRSPLDQYVDAEDAILWINANVVPDAERDALLTALAAIRIDNGGVLTDDGTSQTVTVQTGARLVDKTTLKSG